MSLVVVPIKDLKHAAVATQGYSIFGEDHCTASADPVAMIGSLEENQRRLM